MTQVLIDRATLEQLVEAAECLMEWQVKNVQVWHNSAYDTMDMRLNQFRAALANAEPIGWIAAKDRMPPPQVRVLGYEPQYDIVDVDRWFGPDFNWGYSYWMPLPTPPKEQP